ncbi:MAG: peptide chain release factor-like protein, partial [Thermodesulfobacteriota bacteirum]|nr:peptide chain release factor-like protein [Thermodesulfobacteriota bacterium]
QHQNKNAAMKILSSKLYDLELEKIKTKEEKVNSQKKEIGWGSQVRSYILHPYRMVKDHRTDTEIGDVDSFLDGSFQDLIEKLLSSEK